MSNFTFKNELTTGSKVIISNILEKNIVIATPEQSIIIDQWFSYYIGRETPAKDFDEVSHLASISNFLIKELAGVQKHMETVCPAALTIDYIELPDVDFEPDFKWLSKRALYIHEICETIEEIDSLLPSLDAEHSNPTKPGIAPWQ